MATIGRVVDLRLMIQWDLVSWTDETAYLIRAQGERKIAAPGSSILSPRGSIPSMTLTLRNPSGRFSPFRTDGALYAYLQDGGGYHTPVSMQAQINGGGYYRIFYGLLKNPVETGVTWNGSPTVTIDCRSMEERITQRRVSTTLADFASYIDTPLTEAEIITQWLEDAGLVAGDMQIDGGLHVIPVAWLDEESPLEDCWNLASACGGWFFSDRDGDLNYKNATALATGAASVATYTAGDFTKLTVRYDDKEIYSEIVVEASPRTVDASTVLWEPDDIPYVLSNSAKTITAQLRQPAYEIDALAYNAVTPGGTDISSDVSIIQTQYAQRVELAITNTNTTYACYLRNMQLQGRPVVGAPSIEEKATSSDPFFDADHFRDKRSRRVRGNVYIQTRRQAAMLAEMLRDWHETPRAYLRIENTQGEPTRELLDRVTISDSNVMTNDMDIFVTSINWTADVNGFWQSIEGIAGDDFYPHADEDPEYFVLGTNKLGLAGQADSGRLFY